jgi:hypothetical protein
VRRCAPLFGGNSIHWPQAVIAAFESGYTLFDHATLGMKKASADCSELALWERILIIGCRRCG